MIDKLYEELLPEAKKKQINFYINKGKPLENYELLSDYKKIYKILFAIIKNAVKFTMHGSVEIKCTRENNKLNVKIKDSGIGIEKNKQKIIFKRFSQENKSLSKETGGLGLGLSIAKAY